MMLTDNEIVTAIVKRIGNTFLCFGGGQDVPGNPLGEILKAQPLQFALGVDVEHVVRFVLKERQCLELGEQR